MTLVAGTRLGPYEILGPLGEGGMGVVYRARDPRLDRQGGVKLLAAEMAADPPTPYPGPPAAWVWCTLPAIRGSTVRWPSSCCRPRWPPTNTRGNASARRRWRLPRLITPISAKIGRASCTER